MDSPEPEEPPINATDTVSVLIVDDQAPFRSVARTVVGLTAGFDATAEAETGEEAVRLADELRPDLVLMDINLPGLSGPEATQRIVEAAGDTVVVLLSTYRADDLPDDVADCGAVAYVHKEDIAPAVLLDLWQQHAPR